MWTPPAVRVLKRALRNPCGRTNARRARRGHAVAPCFQRMPPLPRLPRSRCRVPPTPVALSDAPEIWRRAAHRARSRARHHPRRGPGHPKNHGKSQSHSLVHPPPTRARSYRRHQGLHQQSGRRVSSFAQVRVADLVSPCRHRLSYCHLPSTRVPPQPCQRPHPRARPRRYQPRSCHAPALWRRGHERLVCPRFRWEATATIQLDPRVAFHPLVVVVVAEAEAEAEVAEVAAVAEVVAVAAAVCPHSHHSPQRSRP